MKNLLLMLLVSVAMQSQTKNYTVSLESIANPERGFYHNIPTGLVTTTYPLLSQSALNTYRADKVAVIQRIFYLNQFIASPISADYLANMQNDFNTIRNAGLKVIVRFAYSKSQTAVALDATKAQILAHIQQVAPIIQANRDVISVYQYGWIGCWGETYYSSQVAEFGTGDYTQYTATQWANRKEILDAMINATPTEIPVQVRYVYFKQRMYPSGSNRIGFYNDAFLNVYGDSGTFLVSGAQGVPSATDSSYLQTQTTNLPMTGETDAINAPRTDCTNAVIEMDRYNWSLLNKDYLTANITNWLAQGCFADVEKKLGYRFEMLNSTVANNTLTLNLQNTGFANIFKDRKAYLVLRNTTTSTEYPFVLSTDIKLWKSGFSLQIVQSLSLNVPTGTYQLFLSLPDSQSTNPLFAIQCANVGTWDAAKGYNNLNQTVSITNGSVTTPTTPVVTAPTTTPTTTLAVQIALVGNTTITIANLPSTTYTIKVYNLNGRLKATSTNISNLSSGYYVVKVYCNGVTYTQKIYKQ